MAILRVSKDSNFTIIHNSVFMNYELSYKAKGLLCQMLSLPDGWSFSIEGLARLASDGRDSVANTLKELERAGYFRREKNRTDGKFQGIEYIIAEKPFTENPYTEKPFTENPTQLSTKESSIKKSSTDNNKRFVRPTVEQVAEYIRENDYGIDAESFVDYYNANGWKVGKQSMKDWKAAVRNWERRRENDNGLNFGNGNSVRRRVSAPNGRTSGTNGDSGERVRAKLPPMACVPFETE